MKIIKEVYFGEKIEQFDVPVLNEREVRASSGILFLFAIMAFMNVWLLGNFNIMRIFVVVFVIDFIIRLFINPKYSPTLIMGRLIVHRQKPEYVGAPQKKFAWRMGLILSLIMFFLIVVNNNIGPINLLICIICLIFLFFESVFGICLGCMVYGLLYKDKAKLCPGGVCDAYKKEKIQEISISQILIWGLFIVFILFLVFSGLLNKNMTANIQDKKFFNSQNIDKSCQIPDWVMQIGHEDLYKLHHGCK